MKPESIAMRFMRMVSKKSRASISQYIVMVKIFFQYIVAFGVYSDMGRRDRLPAADVGKEGYLVFLLEFLVRPADAAIDRY